MAVSSTADKQIFCPAVEKSTQNEDIEYKLK